MKVTLLCVLFLICLLSGEADARLYDGTPTNPWQPYDPRTFPPNKADDKVRIIYLWAPLLKSTIGPGLAAFDLFHGALGFRNERTNFTWSLNYDSKKVNLFASQLPTITVDKEGNETLIWENGGTLDCYKGINATYWDQQDIGYADGTAMNAYIDYVATFNDTWPYYEMFRLSNQHGAEPYLESKECFDFVFMSVRFLVKRGAQLTTNVLKRNIVGWYAQQPPAKAHYSDPPTRKKIIEFYKLLEFAFGKLTWEELLFELFEVLIDGDIQLASGLCGTAVAFGAFGAHYLKDRFGPYETKTWETATFYALTHGLGALALTIASRNRLVDPSIGTKAVKLLLIGSVIFSGSLYALCLTGQKKLGAITPIGGVLMLAGWGYVAFSG